MLHVTRQGVPGGVDALVVQCRSGFFGCRPNFNPLPIHFKPIVGNLIPQNVFPNLKIESNSGFGLIFSSLKSNFLDPTKKNKGQKELFEFQPYHSKLSFRKSQYRRKL